MGCTRSKSYPQIYKQNEADFVKSLKMKNSPSSIMDEGSNYNIGLISLSKDRDLETTINQTAHN